MDPEEEKEYEVEKVLDVRLNGGRVQFLAKWKGYEDKDNTWETETHFSEGVDNSAIVKFFEIEQNFEKFKKAKLGELAALQRTYKKVGRRVQKSEERRSKSSKKAVVKTPRLEEPESDEDEDDEAAGESQNSKTAVDNSCPDKTQENSEGNKSTSSRPTGETRVEDRGQSGSSSNEPLALIEVVEEPDAPNETKNGGTTGSEKRDHLKRSHSPVMPYSTEVSAHTTPQTAQKKIKAVPEVKMIQLSPPTHYDDLSLLRRDPIYPGTPSYDDFPTPVNNKPCVPYRTPSPILDPPPLEIREDGFEKHREEKNGYSPRLGRRDLPSPPPQFSRDGMNRDDMYETASSSAPPSSKPTNSSPAMPGYHSRPSSQSTSRRNGYPWNTVSSWK